jgi:hypothetical protein
VSVVGDQLCGRGCWAGPNPHIMFGGGLTEGQSGQVGPGFIAGLAQGGAEENQCRTGFLRTGEGRLLRLRQWAIGPDQREVSRLGWLWRRKSRQDQRFSKSAERLIKIGIGHGSHPG